jgi:hypothetical protein
VNREIMDGFWPVTIDHGWLSCRYARDRKAPEVVLTAEDGTQYALNGNAAKTGRYLDVQQIWANDRDGYPKNMTWLIGAGLKLCE